MSTPPRDDSVPHDAWLREALRHAPDAQAAPSTRVDEAVLRLGRASVAMRAAPAAPAPATSPWLDTLAAAWAWLARPPVAAAFAGLMVATVVGLMWWDRPLDDALPPQEAPVAGSAAVPAPAAPTAPDLPRQTAAETARPDAAARRAATAAPAPMPAAPPAPAVQRDLAAAKSAPGSATTAAQGNAAADAAGPRERAVSERRELAAAAPAPATASSTIETPSLSNLRFEIRRRPEAWTWQRDDGEARTMDDAMEAWIAQADRSARPNWQPGALGAEPATATLRFTRGGVVRAVLRLGPAGMRLTRGGKTESATLTGGQSAALLSGLDALGP